MALRQTLLRASIIAALTFPVANLALAAPITWWIAGPVSSHGDPFGGPEDGVHASLAITWEPDTLPFAMPFCPPGSGRVYPAILGATLSYPGVEISYSGGRVEVNAGAGECQLSTLSTEFRTFSTDDRFPQLVVLASPTDIDAPNLAEITRGANSASVLAMTWSGIIFGERYFSFGGPIEVRPVEQPAPIPEPGSLVLLGTGLLGAAAWHRRR